MEFHSICAHFCHFWINYRFYLFSFLYTLVNVGWWCYTIKLWLDEYTTSTVNLFFFKCFSLAVTGEGFRIKEIIEWQKKLSKSLDMNVFECTGQRPWTHPSGLKTNSKMGQSKRRPQPNWIFRLIFKNGWTQAAYNKPEKAGAKDAKACKDVSQDICCCN